MPKCDCAVFGPLLVDRCDTMLMSVWLVGGSLSVRRLSVEWFRDHATIWPSLGPSPIHAFCMLAAQRMRPKPWFSHTYPKHPQVPIQPCMSMSCYGACGGTKHRDDDFQDAKAAIVGFGFSSRWQGTVWSTGWGAPVLIPRGPTLAIILPDIAILVPA